MQRFYNVNGVERVDCMHEDRKEEIRKNLGIKAPGFKHNARSDNVSGIKGVSKRGSRWTAYIHIDGVSRSLGSFTCPLLAQKAYLYAVNDIIINDKCALEGYVLAEADSIDIFA